MSLKRVDKSVEWDIVRQSQEVAMDLGAVAGAQGGVQLHSVAKANEMALAQQAKVLTSQGVSVFSQHESPNVTTALTYSPALYAQAAQYQVYSSSGTLSSLLNPSGSTTANTSDGPPQPDDGGADIHAVEPAEGTHVDTQA